MVRRFLRCAVPVVAAAALTMAPSAAGAASAPGWRITQVLPNSVVGGLTALSARDAWLAGDGCANSACVYGSVIVRHWDGKAWRVVTPPKAFINSPIDQGAGPVVATSASNAWVFAGRGPQSIDYTDALHWTGKGWAAPARFNAAIEAAVAPSANSVWAFGDPETQPWPGYVAHFNGKTWTRGSFPITGTAASALSASDVWVGGTGAAPNGVGIEHWNGHTWRNSPLPNLGLGTSGRLTALAFLVGIAAVGPRDVWANVSVLGGGKNVPGTFVLRWNGKAWTRVPFPFPGTTDSPVAPDGRGGIWLETNVSSGKGSLWFCHYSDGRWTRTLVPSEDGEQPLVFNLSLIPGTRSLWAAGVDLADDGASILKYGP